MAYGKSEWARDLSIFLGLSVFIGFVVYLEIAYGFNFSRFSRILIFGGMGVWYLGLGIVVILRKWGWWVGMRRWVVALMGISLVTVILWRDVIAPQIGMLGASLGGILSKKKKIKGTKAVILGVFYSVLGLLFGFLAIRSY